MMSSLRGTFRKLNRWRRKIRTVGLDRQTRLAIEQTFDVRSILNELNAPKGLMLPEEVAVYVLELMVDRQFLIQIQGDEDEDAPFCDWKRMAQSVVDALQLGNNCSDPAVRGVAAFLHLANVNPTDLASMVPESSHAETTVFAIIVLTTFIALFQSVASSV